MVEFDIEDVTRIASLDVFRNATEAQMKSAIVDLRQKANTQNTTP